MTTATAYDEVRYSNYPYAQTHPDRLATVAALHGLPSPDPETARVLEIGCGAGGNLIAMAVATPGITRARDRPRRRADRRGPRDDRGGRPGQRRAAPGRRLRPARRRARRVRLRDRPRRLRVGPGAGARRPAARDPRAPRGRRARATSPTTPTRAATCAARCARPGCGSPRDAARRASSAPSGRASCTGSCSRTAPAPSDWWGGLLESQLEAARAGPGVPARARRPQRPLGAGLVRRLRRARRGERARLRGRRATSPRMLPERVPTAVADELDALTGGDRIRREQLIDILRCVFFRQSVLCRDSRRPADAPDAVACCATCTSRRAPASPAPSSRTGCSARRSRCCARARPTRCLRRAARGDGRRPGRALATRCTRASWPSS